ncbi:complex I subunit 1 family protein [Limibacter armeniacum]|uniref:complex I subunit 1/NuoH family protein n=1 Tax=Limibacter armeniacum TaxID=466084 RepID=UPI002FE5FBF0
MLALIILLLLIPVYALYGGVYGERKISAFIQDRLGPMETGKFGLLQTAADILKLLMKEDTVPAAADKFLFKAAPMVMFAAVFAGFAVIPLSPDLIGSEAEVGVFFLLAIVALDIIGILMAGWGSNNKYSLYGAMRAAAQMISYEIPLGLAVLCVVMISQTLNLQEISIQQSIYLPMVSDEANYLFGIKALGIDVTNIGGILTWNIIRSPFLLIAFVIYYIASLAEANRAPFDIPEAESELIAGFHTEYSGIRFAYMFLAEYGTMLLVSLLAAVLFLGSWNTPLPNLGPVKLAEWTSGAPGTIAGNIWGMFWVLSKALLLVFSQMWVRWTYPRLRVDQLMSLCWKYLTPISLVLVFISGIWRLLMI